MLARVLVLHPEVGAFHEPRPWLLTEAYLRWSGRRDGEFASRKVESGCIVALEHEERFAERSRRLLDRYGGSQRATVVHAPVTDREGEGQPRPWYGPEAEEAVTERLDLLLVDGPPGPLAPESRYPAVPLLKDRLAPDAVIFLDDGRRPEEARIAESWAEQLGVEPRFVDSGRGIWVFKLE